MILREYFRFQPVRDVVVGAKSLRIKKPNGLHSAVEILAHLFHQVRGADKRRNDFDRQIRNRGQRRAIPVHTVKAFIAIKRDIRPAYGGFTQLEIQFGYGMSRRMCIKV